jgi:uncharacterized membrane protein
LKAQVVLGHLLLYLTNLAVLFFLAVIGFALVFSTVRDTQVSSEGISFSVLPVDEMIGFSSRITKLWASIMETFEVIRVSRSTTIRVRIVNNFILNPIKNCDYILI